MSGVFSISSNTASPEDASAGDRGAARLTVSNHQGNLQPPQVQTTLESNNQSSDRPRRIPESAHENQRAESQQDTASDSPSLDTAPVEIPFIGDDANPWLEELLQQLLAKDFSLAPVVLYGASGTGKTLLARTLVLNLSQTYGWTSNEWMFHTAIDFARQVGQALETNSLGLFRTRFDDLQALVLDDCQELAGKSQAQRELRLLIERFADTGRLLIITAPLVPTRMEGITAGLASRMSDGIGIPIHPPGEEARQVIFQQLFEQQHVELTTDALTWLSEQVSGPVPEMIRHVNRICFEVRDRITDRISMNESEAIRQAIRVTLKREDIQSMLQGTPAVRPSTRVIANQVAKAFHLKLKDLTSQSRRQSIVRARGIAMYLSRRITDESLEKIGDFFGGRDHTTVLHSCRKIEKDLQSDEETACVMQELAESLQIPWSIIATPFDAVDA